MTFSSLRRCIFAVTTSLILITTTFISATFADGSNKALVCHESKSGKINSLWVSESAVAAHTDHGDIGPFEFYLDADGDGFGNPESDPVVLCEAPDGYVLDNTDCNDDNSNQTNGDGCNVGPVEYPVQIRDLFFVNGIISEIFLDVAPEWLQSDIVSLSIEASGINGGFHEHGMQEQLVSSATVLFIDQSIAIVSVDWNTDQNITASPETYTVCVQAMVNGQPFGLENCNGFGPF